jgi:hypothetical protein
MMVLTGVFWSTVIVSQVYYYDKKKLKIYSKELDDETKNEVVEFSEKYKDEIIRIKYNLDNYTENNNSDEDSDLDSLDDNSIEQIEKPDNEDEYKDFFKNQFVNMENENYGIIHMKWNPEDDTYLYYARSREIPYVILDTVCRKFVLTYDNCDNYHINFNHHHKQESESDNGEFEKINDDDKKEQEEEEEEEKPKGIFAIFKSSKKKDKLIKKNDKKINHFKYVGNLYDYEDMLKKDELNKEEPKILSYNDFKNIKLD